MAGRRRRDMGQPLLDPLRDGGLSGERAPHELAHDDHGTGLASAGTAHAGERANRLKLHSVLTSRQSMAKDQPKFRFLLIQAFHLSGNTKYQLRSMQGAKESMLMNYGDFAHLLDDVAWEVDPGATDPHGNWPVETREEFAIVGVSRLPIVKSACQSGKYNAIVLLCGGDPGLPEAREIGRRYGIPVTACFSAQLHVAAMLGNRFSVIDISEAHNMHLCDLVVHYRFQDKCASVRNVNFPLPRPPDYLERPIQNEKQKVERGGVSEMLETAIAESVAAIEEDGAEVIV